MDLDKKQWKILTNIDPPRARPLVSVNDHVDPPYVFHPTNCSATNFSFTVHYILPVAIVLLKKAKLFHVNAEYLSIFNFQNVIYCLGGRIEEYHREKKTWQVIADIPHFKTANGLATKNNKL